MERSTDENNPDSYEDPIKQGRIIALVEVLIVSFVVHSFLILGLSQLLYGSTEPSPLPLSAPYLFGFLWFVIPAIMILGLGRSLSEYGLALKSVRQSVSLSLDAFLFFILTNVGFIITMMMGWSYLEPSGALLVTAFFILALLLIMRLVSQKYANFEAVQISQKTHRTNILVIFLLLMLPIILGVGLGRLSGLLITTVVWQFIFSGFGEEVFFRGYVQSRLNVAFGRPYEWRGIRFGAGLFIASLIFAAIHVLSIPTIWLGNLEMAWWWGTFTFVGGALFGLLREKTQSVVAPGILHGLEGVGEALALLF